MRTRLSPHGGSAGGAGLAGSLSQSHDPIRRNLAPGIATAGRPADLDEVHLRRRAQPEVDSGIVGRQVAAVAPHPALDRGPVFPDQLHNASVPGPVGADPFQADQNPMPALGCVQEQVGRTIIVGHQNVHTAVVVHIAEYGRPADVAVLEGRAGGSRNILEALALTHVAKQQVAFAVGEWLALLGRYGLNRSIRAEQVQQAPIPDVQ